MKSKLAIALAAVALTFTAFSSPVAAAPQCDDTVQSNESIQTAINAATAGYTICVEPGEYNETLKVNKNITVTGTQPPKTNPATVTGVPDQFLESVVEVSGDGATFKKMKVSPSEPIKVRSDAGILVTGNQTTIKKNLVEDLTANGTNPYTINGIQVWNDGPEQLQNVLVKENTVKDVRNLQPRGAVGIKVQGVVNGVNVKGNNVEDIHGAGWAWGIVTTDTGNAPDVSPENVAVKYNDVRKVNDGSVYDVFNNTSAAPYPGSAFGADGATNATQLEVHYNNFVNPISIINRDNNTLDAENNYYGHASGPAARTNPAGKQVGKGGDIIGLVDWNPYLVQPFDKTPQKQTPPQRGP